MNLGNPVVMKIIPYYRRIGRITAELSLSQQELVGTSMSIRSVGVNAALLFPDGWRTERFRGKDFCGARLLGRERYDLESRLAACSTEARGLGA